MDPRDVYQTSLNTRYASSDMVKLFSERTRINTWRQLWLWLAEAEADLGLNVSKEAIQQMQDHLVISNDEFNIASEEEKRVRHDVMSHVHTFGQSAPLAAGIIHLGATSCFVTDNAEQILMKRGIQLLLPKLARCIRKLSDFAIEHKSLSTLGYTHLQAAQLTTVGKRFSLHVHSLLRDLRNWERALDDLDHEFRGCKGTTGTQASYLQLFSGDHAKVEALDELVTQKAGFASAVLVSSQTYDRKVDVDILQALGSFGATVQKFGGDVRHLAANKELQEPFEKNQTGSSAMAYKRNPMRSERLCALGRQLANKPKDAIDTFAAQLFERTLDDSAIRRSAIPESFLLADACLKLLDNISSGLVVYPSIIQRRINAELPFMATENVIAALTAKGLSRQHAHEEIKTLSHEAAAVVMEEGKDNDLIERIRRNDFFAPILPELDNLLDPSTFTGRAPEQVEKFVRVSVEPALEKYHEHILNAQDSELNV